MAEYIDREDAIDAVLIAYFNTPKINLNGELFYNAIRKLQPADVEPVKRGRWIYNTESGECVCSACGENALSFRKDTLYGVDLYETCLTDYCPNCGADMRGSNDE